MKSSANNLRLKAIGIALFILLQYPAISFFSIDKYILGIPVLFIYLLTIWILAILMIYRLSSSQSTKSEHSDE